MGIERLMDRVTKVETSVAWLKGGWAILVAGLLYVFKAA